MHIERPSHQTNISNNLRWRPDLYRPDLYMTFQQPVYFQYIRVQEPRRQPQRQQQRSFLADLLIAISPVALPLAVKALTRNRRN